MMNAFSISLMLATLGCALVAGITNVREKFEPRWLRWNGIRTWLALAATIMLLIVLLRI